MNDPLAYRLITAQAAAAAEASTAGRWRVFCMPITASPETRHGEPSSYPDCWPETIRGLLVHAAEWTQP